jgi:hypothetical protein
LGAWGSSAKDATDFLLDHTSDERVTRPVLLVELVEESEQRKAGAPRSR